MRGRAAIVSLLVVAGVMAAGGAALQAVGVRSPSGEATGGAPSGTWFCPHGGGEGWSTRLSLTNPGAKQVIARVRTYGRSPIGIQRSLSIPARSVVDVPVSAEERGQGTMVEYFGGWIAAGWVAEAAGDESGVAAEPCLSEAGRSWLLPDGTTEKGQDAYVVVMNPFASEAVFSVTLVTERRTVRAKEWSNFVLPPGRSTALHLNDNALGEQTVATELHVSIGRVAAASLGVAASGGIRSAVGVPRAARRVILPGAADAGPSDVPILNPASAATTYGVSVLGGTGPRQAQDLTGQQLGPGSDRTEHVTASGAAVVVQASGDVAAGRRSFGLQGDQGSTAGVTAPAGAWVVSSPGASGADQVRLYLTNPGRRNVRVELFTLTPDGTGPGPIQTVDVAAGTTAQLVTDAVAPPSSVIALSAGGTFVPVEASYSRHGAGYAVAVGVPIPSRWMPEG
jgi:Family of unknown function (DUF5719)